MDRLVALALTVATGFSALVYEVTWQKYLATLLGSHSEATAAVLGIFLGGLALGYGLFGSLSRRLVARGCRSRRARRLLVTYGLVEAAIGAWALVFPGIFTGVQALSLRVPHGSGGLGFALDVTLSALLVGPPAVLMGATIPMLTQALARSLADATRLHALVYGWNTAGAFAGTLAAGFWLVPALGLVGVLAALGMLNLTVGAAFVALGVLGSPTTIAAEPVAPPPRWVRGPEPAVRAFALVALLSGFAMMTLQTILIRVGSLSLGSSEFTFSMVVATFVLSIAVGSFAVSALPRIPAGALPVTLWVLVGLLYLLYTPLQDAPYWAHVLRSLFRDQAAGFYPYHLLAFATLLLVIGPPLALSGATLPLIFHQLRRRAGDLGNVAGRIYGWNTAGALLGALGGGWAALYWLDLHHVVRLAMAALAAGAAVVTARVPSRRWRRATVPLLIAAAAITFLPPWSPERLSSGLFRLRQPAPYTFDGPDAFFASHPRKPLVYYRDDPTASVGVLEYPVGDQTDRVIVINGKPDSSTLTDRMTTGLLALLPALFAERTERAFVVGWGTGVTAGELAALRSVGEVVVAEISPGVLDAAPLFDPANGNASRDPKIRVVQGDAYRTLLRTRQRFDVIASEPSNPWVAGVEMLFSREFLAAARDRLAPGGVHAQWLHTYETDDETVAMVLRTYAAVFPHVGVWNALETDLILLGFRDPAAALDLDRLAARVEQPDFAAALRRCRVPASLPALLAHELLPLGVVHATPLPGDVHTLLHPRLSHLAARAFFAGAPAGLPNTAGPEPARVGRRNSLVQRYLARRGGELRPDERAQLVGQTCVRRPRECVTMLAWWVHDVPQSAARDLLVKAIRNHPVAGLATPLDRVGALSRLFADPPPAPDGTDTLADATEASDLFGRYHHHAAPFSRRALGERWRRCEADPAVRQRCRDGRAAAEAAFGDLG
jgi:predicted membrane-bound spermidine synthase